jgi:hypothetical protein
MALKKSELYSSLWSSCDELRGGMDASQYKDYVLVLLFIKYVSDKYAGQPYAPITIPKGASFKDMVALKGNDRTPPQFIMTKPSIAEPTQISGVNGLDGQPIDSLFIHAPRQGESWLFANAGLGQLIGLMWSST